ncbi:MAG: translation initiation factor IF-2 N-terminal domain-containing protein, partial [Armatimonadetes bacterium]|nr:translation initiation factor IF-2 N-terminal domain-containing protein [Armatimonadota bacterium]
MAKIRIFSLANKLGLRTEALIKVLSDMGVEDVSPASPVDPETASAAVELLIEQAEEARRQAQAAAEAQAAQEETRPGADAAAVVEEEWEEQFAAPVHDADLKEGLAELEQYLAELQAATDEEHPETPEVKPLSELAARPTGERPDSAVDVPPVVTVLGHVDHG